MDLSRCLLTTLIDEDKLNEVTRSGISIDFFDDDECKSVFNYIGRHYSQYKKVPSRTAVTQAFPNFEFVTTQEPLEYFIEQTKEAYRRSVLEDGLFEASNTYTSDTKRTESLLREMLGDLSITQRTFQDIDLASTASERLRQYDIRKQHPGADGVLSAWGTVDYLTLGWHAEEFILLVGEKYQGKSWLLIWLAYQAMLQGERVLIATQEMSQDALARRFDSIYAGVCFDSLRRGELSHVEEQRYTQKLGEFEKSSHQITLIRDGVNTIEDIEQKAVEHDATIVFADSVYLFNADTKGSFSGETPRRMAVSQACKGASRRLGIPFIATTQAGRKKSKGAKPDLDDIEWTNAFSQDADVVMLIEKDEVDRELGMLWIHVLKSRDGDVGVAGIKTDFDYMSFNETDKKKEPSTQIMIEEDTIFDG